MLLWVEGFEGFGQTNGNVSSASGTPLAQKYTPVGAAGISIQDGYTSGKSLRFTSAGTGLTTPQFSAITEFIIGIRFKYTNSGGFPGVLINTKDSGTLHLNLVINASDQLYVRRGGTTLATGTTVLSSDTWYYIEFKGTTHDTTGSYEVRIDGVTELSATGVDTRNGGSNNSINEVQIIGDNASTYQFDDWYIADTTGSLNNDFLGPGRVFRVIPNAAGTQSDWTPDTGTNYQRVDEDVSDDDTSYVETSTNNDEDFYDFSTLTADEIKGAQLNISAKRTDTGAYDVNLPILSGATQNDGSANSLSASYDHYFRITETDPNTSAAWSVSNWNSAEFGIKVTSAGSPGNARVTQMLIEAYTVASAGTDKERATSNTLSLSQSALSGSELEEDAASVLSLSGVGSFSRDRFQGASSLLDLDHEAINLWILESISSTLGLSQSATQNLKFETVAQALGLDTSVFKGSTLEESVASVLALTDSPDQNLKFASGASVLSLAQDVIYNIDDDIHAVASNTLSLSGAATTGNFVYNRSIPIGPADQSAFLGLAQTLFLHGDRNLSVAQAMNLLQTVSVRQAIVNLSVSQAISFSQAVGRVLPEAAASALTLIHTAFRIFKPSSALALAQTAVGLPFKITTSSLALTQTLSKLQEYARSASDTLTISQSIAIELNSPDLCNYNPTVGTAGSGITPPPTTAPTLTPSTLQLRYPAAAPTLTVVLRNPEFANTDALQFNRIKRESRGGTLLVFADPTWPKVQKLTLQINTLKQTTRNELQVFLESSIGREILLDDWEGRTWQGIITNPDAEITQTGRTEYSVTLEFEGNLV